MYNWKWETNCTNLKLTQASFLGSSSAVHAWQLNYPAVTKQNTAKQTSDVMVNKKVEAANDFRLSYARKTKCCSLKQMGLNPIFNAF